MFSLGGILPSLSLFLNHISVKSWGLVVKWRHPLQLRGWIKWECVRDAQIRIRRNYPPKWWAIYIVYPSSLQNHSHCVVISTVGPNSERWRGPATIRVQIPFGFQNEIKTLALGGLSEREIDIKAKCNGKDLACWM